MAISVKGIVGIHKRHTKDLIKQSEQKITLRFPVTRTSSSVNPLFGDFTRETDTTGITRGPFNCLWYDALSSKSMSSTGAGFEQTVERLSGQYRGATSFAELWLEDVLVDPTDVSGKTWFDSAQTVLYSGQKFKVLGEVRLSLSTSAPYILMVVLKGGQGYSE